MTHDEFWQVISDSRCDFDPNRQSGNLDLQVERLTGILTALPANDVPQFQDIFLELYFNAYRWDLWGAAYVIEGGCGDDGFMDFRNWLISMGRDVYEAALADAESLVDVAAQPGVETTQFEEFGSIVGRVMEERNIPESEAPPDFRHPQTPAGEPWTEEDLPAHFPRLWSKFGDAGP